MSGVCVPFFSLSLWEWVGVREPMVHESLIRPSATFSQGEKGRNGVVLRTVTLARLIDTLSGPHTIARFPAANFRGFPWTQRSEKRMC